MTRTIMNPKHKDTRKRPTIRPQAESLEGRLLLTAGELDPDFGIGGGGIVAESPRPETSNKYWSTDVATAVLVQPNDLKIVVAGHSAGQWGLVRLMPNGQPDSAFDGDGRVLTSFQVTSLSNEVTGMAFQGDGKILVVGPISNQTTVRGVTKYNIDFGVVRYNPNGSRDTTFEGDGIVTTNVSTYQSSGTDNQYDLPYQVAAQADGKILVGGLSQTGSGTYHASMVRYNSNGTLDGTFGVGGKVVLDVPDGSSSIRGLAVLPNGKIQAILGHYLARFTSSGSLDPSYGSGGLTFVNPGTTGSYGMQKMAVYADGSVLAAGSLAKGTNDKDLFLVRAKPDGTLDTTFGSNGSGTITHDLDPGSTGTDNIPNGIHSLSDGKILVTTGHLVGRFNANGSRDDGSSGDATPGDSFGTAGVVYTIPPGSPGIFHGSTLQPYDQKFITVGEGSGPNTPSGDKDFLIARFLGDTPIAASESIASGGTQTNPGKDPLVLIPVAPAAIDLAIDQLAGKTRKHKSHVGG